GVIKMLLSLQHRTRLSTLHLRSLNPYIKLDGTPFYVGAKTEAWPAPLDEFGNALPRRAGVSSFGFGGAIAHVILEEAPARPQAAETGGPCLIVLSARNEERLQAVASGLRAHVEKSPDLSLRDFACTLQIGRAALETRAAFVARDREDLL